MSECATPRRPGGRSARVRRAVIDATLDALHARGMEGLAIADVAAQAGVHETSIYRRWGSREHLMVDALLDEAEELLPVPDTGSLREDLLAYATSLAAYLASPIGKAFDRALAATGDDQASRQTRDQYWSARAALSTQIIRRAIDRGELPDTIDPRLAIEVLVAPLHFKVVLTREPLDPVLPTRLVDAVLRGISGAQTLHSQADKDAGQGK